MTYPVWPEDLPHCILQEGFSNDGAQPVRRQQMESGLDRVTRISSTTVRTNTYSIALTQKQLAIFWSFYENAANAGADIVLIPMLTGNKIILHACRFASYPSLSKFGLNWRITFTLETGEQHNDWS
jgi:hypothetical protein